MKKLILFILFFLTCHQAIFAKQTFSEDFSNNLGQWELINGNWSYWQIRNQALYATISQSRKLSTIVPKDEFWQGMEEYTVDFIFKVFDNTDKNFVVGMRDAANFYDFHFYNNDLIVEDIRNGFSIHSVAIPFALELDKDYAMHLLYSKDKIELLIDGELIFHTDYLWLPPSYGGKFGLKIATGGVAHSQAYFDQVVVQSFNSTQVLFKQNDPLWANAIYDHASDWSSEPTMSRWGCALSSVAMLLKAYGYHNLPNGEVLSPLSLNQWLMEETDGYIANGLVNWLAISRLSRILSEQNNNGLPKLEFHYFKASPEENLDYLRTHLSDSFGQIATDGQHFFLVERYLAELHEFIIKDPLYEQDLLSQKNESLESLRIFTPSLTDLSYLLLVLPRELSVIFSNEASGSLNLASVAEQIISNEETLGADYQLIYYPKPNDGTFNLLLQSEEFSSKLLEQIQILIYQSDGEVQQIMLGDLIDNQQEPSQIKDINLTINYFKNTQSAVSLSLEEKSLDEQKLEKLAELTKWSKTSFEAGELSFYLFYQLSLLIDSIRDHLNYFFLLEKFLEFHGL
jgi:uncharacterized protein YutD